MDKKEDSVDAREAADRLSNRMIERAMACEIRGNEIIIDPNGAAYPVRLDQCASHEAIIEWVLHLCEKKWISVGLLEQFILEACSHHGLTARRDR